VRLAAFGAAGRRVRQIVAGMRPSGEHAETSGGRAVGAGFYFARLEVSGQAVLTRRIAVMR
jgi:hypothetical protein